MYLAPKWPAKALFPLLAVAPHHFIYEKTDEKREKVLSFVYHVITSSGFFSFFRICIFNLPRLTISGVFGLSWKLVCYLLSSTKSGITVMRTN